MRPMDFTTARSKVTAARVGAYEGETRFHKGRSLPRRNACGSLPIPGERIEQPESCRRDLTRTIAEFYSGLARRRYFTFLSSLDVERRACAQRSNADPARIGAAEASETVVMALLEIVCVTVASWRARENLSKDTCPPRSLMPLTKNTTTSIRESRAVAGKASAHLGSHLPLRFPSQFAPTGWARQKSHFLSRLYEVWVRH